MEDFYEFMKERIHKADRRGSNCIGAALYIVGEIPSETYISRKISKKNLNRLRTSSKPELGYIVLWESDGIPFHAGVILNMNPLKIVHRNEINGLLKEQSLEELTNHLFKYTKIKPVYKIPGKLKDIK